MVLAVQGVAGRLCTVRGAGALRLDRLRPVAGMAGFFGDVVAYREVNAVAVRRRELPNGQATLIFNLGAPLRIEHPVAVRAAFAAGCGFFSGASTRYAISEMEGAQAGVQVMLTLPGARRLLGRPLAEFGDALIDPAMLLPGIAALSERLQALADPVARVALLEAWAWRRMVAGAMPPADLLFAWRRLVACGGRVAVAALAAEIGCSRKHLTVRFTREFGLAPKVLARLLQFDGAMRRLRSGAVRGLADLAADCGYADQSHMVRAFHDFAGATPLSLARRALPEDSGFTD